MTTTMMTTTERYLDMRCKAFSPGVSFAGCEAVPIKSAEESRGEAVSA